jgi:hypothetical protein
MINHLAPGIDTSFIVVAESLPTRAGSLAEPACHLRSTDSKLKFMRNNLCSLVIPAPGTRYQARRHQAFVNASTFILCFALLRARKVPPPSLPFYPIT